MTTEQKRYFKLLDEAFQNQPKCIKVTKEFSNYLEAKCKDEIAFEKINDSKGFISYYTGIPIVIDDSIENGYYEFEY